MPAGIAGELGVSLGVSLETAVGGAMPTNEKAEGADEHRAQECRGESRGKRAMFESNNGPSGPCATGSGYICFRKATPSDPNTTKQLCFSETSHSSP